jgi:heterodisulfide reductase subunit A
MTEEYNSRENNLVPISDGVRIGVYTCHCGGNISHVVDCELVADLLGKLPNVVISRTDPSFCSDAGQAIIEQDIKELGVDRVVVGACAPSLHELTFRNTVMRAGLNPYLYHHVGLREQDSWVHSDDMEGATEKAIRLMSAGVAKARLLQPLDPIRLSAEKHAIVIGGGAAGLRSALDIARQEINVTLVEKSPFLGGRMAQLTSVFPTDQDAHALLHPLIQEVIQNERITVLTQAEVKSVAGYVGNFDVIVTQHSRGVDVEIAEKVEEACTQYTADEFNYGLTERKVIYRPYPGCYPDTLAVDWEQYDGQPISMDGKEILLKDEPQDIQVYAGAIVMATGFNPYEPYHGEFGYGELPEVVTLPQLIRILARLPEDETLTWNGHPVRDIALIHCVGSRQLEGIDEPQPDGQVNNYCSRVCCTATLHTSVEIRRRFPKMNIYELYQDIRAYGRGHEDIYRKAQDSGVRFFRYHGDEQPQVMCAPAGDAYPLLVRVKDYLTYGEEIELPVDLVVLSVGMMPRQVDDLVNMLKISRGADRFLLEVHPKLRPVEMAVRGIVLAGTAQGPMNIQESLAAASAAAAKVSVLLGQGKVELPPYVAHVEESICEGTGDCVQACPEEGAITLHSFNENGQETKRALVTAANCTGCGACVSACPNRAIDIQSWTLAQYEAMVDAIAMEIPALMEIENE